MYHPPWWDDTNVQRVEDYHGRTRETNPVYAGAHLQKTEFMRTKRNQKARHAGSWSLNSKSRIDMV